MPDLFGNEEKAKLVEEMESQKENRRRERLANRELDNKPGHQIEDFESDELDKQIPLTERFERFLRVCKKNLKIILAFSPIGEILRSKARNFPQILTCVTIDWFIPWPDTAFQETGRALLNQSELISNEKRESLIFTLVNNQKTFQNLSLSHFL